MYNDNANPSKRLCFDVICDIISFALIDTILVVYLIYIYSQQDFNADFGQSVLISLMTVV